MAMTPTFQQCSANSIPPDLQFAGDLCLQNSNFPNVTNGNTFVILDQNGKPILFSPSAVYGTIDRTSVHATTFGTALQATDKDKFFGHDNYLTFGASVDRSLLSFSAKSELGMIFPNFVVGNGGFPGSGSIIATAGGIGYVPTFLTGNTTYYGVYALDTFNITPELALTAGGRLNIAQIVTEDATGFAPELNINNAFSRINPVVGLTYKILPTVTAYGGYSEANRAPTPLEIDCANPNQPCILENSLVSDPPIKQVVAHTVEAGLRGGEDVFDKGRVDWKAGFFRTDSTNDIVALASTIPGRQFFANVPSTLRQGVEAEANFHNGNLRGPVEAILGKDVGRMIEERLAGYIAYLQHHNFLATEVSASLIDATIATTTVSEAEIRRLRDAAAGSIAGSGGCGGKTFGALPTTCALPELGS